MKTSRSLVQLVSIAVVVLGLMAPNVGQGIAVADDPFDDVSVVDETDVLYADGIDPETNESTAIENCCRRCGRARR